MAVAKVFRLDTPLRVGPVSSLLAGKANVYAWITGVKVRRKNIERLQTSALGAAAFDVVHLNIGLHGLGESLS